MKQDRENEKSLILFGLDEVIPWNVLRDTSDGKMTLTSSTYDGGKGAVAGAAGGALFGGMHL